MGSCRHGGHGDRGREWGFWPRTGSAPSRTAAPTSVDGDSDEMISSLRREQQRQGKRRRNKMTENQSTKICCVATNDK